MKLLEALQIINQAAASGGPVHSYTLATGFTPLALETFLRAHLQQRRAGGRVELEAGRYGDLLGNVERAGAAGTEGVAVVVEWSDLDPRLGYRSVVPSLAPEVLDDVVRTAAKALERLRGALAAAGGRGPVAVCAPTLPLPPVFHARAGTASAAMLSLRAQLQGTLAALAATPGVRVVDSALLDTVSPAAERLDVASDLATGFPYHRGHAESVAGALAAALLPAPAKKGIITDLDDTVWRGILGEIGVDGVQWTLEHKSQVHGLYQQCLAALADAGVLVAIASKNDPELVTEAMRRSDLVLRAERVFPVEASWGPKSAAVASILKRWNIGADSVVFVDDSPLELAEVEARFPEIVCFQFRPNDPASVLRLLHELRALCGRDEVRDEDRLRLASLRASDEMREAAADAVDEDAFLRGLDAEVTFELTRTPRDARPLELVNKTNQFNLSGRRFSEAEWTAALERPDAFVLTVGYADKFGPLGRIGVVVGTAPEGGEVVAVDQWVLSCRAFARRIEHLTLRILFDTFGASGVTLDFAPTPRNGPLQDFLVSFGVDTAEAGERMISRADFEARCPALHHTRVLESDLAIVGRR